MMITISERKQALNWDENAEDRLESVTLNATYGNIGVD